MVPIGKKRPASSESGPGPSCITLRPRPLVRGVPSGLFLKYSIQRGSFSLLMTPEAPGGGSMSTTYTFVGCMDSKALL